MADRFTRGVMTLSYVFMLWLVVCSNIVRAAELDGPISHNGTVSLSVRNVELHKVMEMLS